jgi:hypothetical protein
MPREVRAAYREMQKGVDRLDASIADLGAGLRRAEARIEGDARRRIRELCRDARTQLHSLQSRQREAVRMMKHLSAAAGDSWREIQRSANSIFTDARRTTVTLAKRFRRALSA